MVQFADALTLDAPRRTRDGFMAVRAKASRAGTYQYLGSEIDPTGTTFKADQIVNVYRSPDEVFAADSVASFLGKPVTNDHPSQPVTADNWKRHARGGVMGAMRDGEHLAFDLAIMDADTIAAIDAGKRELSNGYACELVIGDGVAPDGTKYEARQTNIRGNHVAVVDRGRAGSSCRIGDAQDRFAVCDANTAALSGFTPETKMTKITLDGGLLLDLADADAVAAAINKFRADAATAATALTDAQTQNATLVAAAATDAAKIATLETQLADAKLTPAALRDAAKAYADVVAKGKALGVTVTDAMDEAAIMAAAVTAKLGDRAKDWTPEQIAASFHTLSASDGGNNVVNIIPARETNDAATSAYAKMIADMTGASTAAA